MFWRKNMTKLWILNTYMLPPPWKHFRVITISWEPQDLFFGISSKGPVGHSLSVKFAYFRLLRAALFLNNFFFVLCHIFFSSKETPPIDDNELKKWKKRTSTWLQLSSLVFFQVRIYFLIYWYSHYLQYYKNIYNRHSLTNNRLSLN